MQSTKHSTRRERVFLSADWRDLVMLNYAVDPELLLSYVPGGVGLDTFDGKTLVSLVGFRFLRTKILGALPIPFHANFDEVNLRFYVRRRHPEGDRRGVVFIREIVPRRAIAYLARLAYGERYSRFPMRHRITTDGDSRTLAYEWRIADKWCRLHVEAQGDPALPPDGSLAQFITEHYWGYSAQRDGGSLEYHVTHIPWRVWPCTKAAFEGDATSFYGSALATALRAKPHSAFVAEGSSVSVFTSARIA